MFFTFSQNNSGGSFDHDDDLDEFVIIQAVNAVTANAKAESLGIYFNGCMDNVDCSCCGDRWYDVDDSDGTIEPLVYGDSPSKHKYHFGGAIVHYEDGTRLSYVSKDARY